MATLTLTGTELVREKLGVGKAVHVLTIKHACFIKTNPPWRPCLTYLHELNIILLDYRIHNCLY